MNTKKGVTYAKKNKQKKYMNEDLQGVKKGENTDMKKYGQQLFNFSKREKIISMNFFFLFLTARLKKVEHSVPEIQVIFYHSHKSNCHCIYE